MMSNGKAFEWAVGLSLTQIIGAVVVMDAQAQNVQTHYERMTPQTQVELLNAANVAMESILRKESTFVQRANAANPATIFFNTDAAGQQGDVRDVILQIGNRSLGISCKYNHKALKHSRLSGVNDFINVWGLDVGGCSQEYWDRVIPLFDELQTIKDNSNGADLWRDMEDKDTRYYWPILNAWADEVHRVCGDDSPIRIQACRAMIAYLVGVHDFYKVMYESEKSSVHIQSFNFNNTLDGSRTKYPDYINSINSRNGGQYSKTITFNRGYSINFRIHSASTSVEPSLKFDINAISLPAVGIYHQTLDV